MRSPRLEAMRLLALGSLITALAAPVAVRADTVGADADIVTPGPQSTVDLGVVAPGALMTLEVPFVVVCANGSHLDAGQVVLLETSGGIVPAGGDIVSVTSGATGPVPADWTMDGESCPSPAPSLSGGVPSTVVLRAPESSGEDLEYLLTWSRTITPAGVGDSRAVSGGPHLIVRVDVRANTPPVVQAPVETAIEADVAGGWAVDLSPYVTVADAEDDPDPSAACDVDPGDTLPLGTTTVTCTATDTQGAVGTATLDVTVVDTIAPALASHPDIEIATGDPTGAVLTFEAPTATDIADPDPQVACAPGSGSLVAVGTTRVTCTVTDASGNIAATAFDVRVTYIPAVVVRATWLEPVGVAEGGTFVTNRGRTLPVKVTLAIDGVVRTAGDARLHLEPCGGGTPASVPLTFGGGRWNVAVDTAALAGACHRVTASIDGLEAGTFRLELRGAELLTASRGGGRR